MKSGELKQNGNHDNRENKTLIKSKKFSNQLSITGVTPLSMYNEKSFQDKNIQSVEVDYDKILDVNNTSKSSEEKQSSRKKKLHSSKPHVLEEINYNEENNAVLKTPTFDDVYGSRQKKEGKESIKRSRKRKANTINTRDKIQAKKRKISLNEVTKEELPPLLVKRKQKSFLSSTVEGVGSTSNVPLVFDASEILPAKKRKFFKHSRISHDYDPTDKGERWQCFGTSNFKLRQRHRINYDESLFDSIGSPAGDSIAACTKNYKKCQGEKVQTEISSKFDINDESPFANQIKFSDWRSKYSQKQIKVKKYGPSRNKTKSIFFANAPVVELNEDTDFEKYAKDKLRKDDITRTVYSDFVPDQCNEDITRNCVSPVVEDAKISVAFDETIKKLGNQIQQISDLPEDEKSVYRTKAKQLAELSHMFIFNILL